MKFFKKKYILFISLAALLLGFTSKHITKIRYGKHKNSVRLVLDNPRRMNYKIFSLKPNSRYKHYRLVVDLTDKKYRVQRSPLK